MLLDELPGRTFQKWAERRFNWTAEMGCRQSVASLALLMSQDEQIAFDLFFDLRKQAVADIADFKSDGTDDFELPQEELVSFITNGRFKDRPGMWLGGASVDALWALCSGFVWAERDGGLDDSEAQRFLAGFQNWIEERYPFSRGRPWNKTIDFLALHLPERAWKSCFEMIDMFRNGTAPDSLSMTGRQLLQGLTKAIVEQNADMTPEDVAREWGDVVKGICPS